jgi:L-asparaginase
MTTKTAAVAAVIATSLMAVGCSTGTQTDNQSTTQAPSAPTTAAAAGTASPAPAKRADLPNITILGTGGTIAGTAESADKVTGYTAGVLTPDQLIQAVPALKDIANISAKQVAQIDSGISNTDAVMIKLAQETQTTLDDPACDGVVITHGTDTLEESAYFLNLTVHSDKPIVVVGSMRPSTAISADGPLNLYNAVGLAGSKEAKGKGVLIALNDKVGDARNTYKTSAVGVDTFKNPELGYLGYIQDGKPNLYTEPLRIHTDQSDFDIRKLPDTLSRVDIVYSRANDDRVFVDAAVGAGAKGIIHAGTGNGSINEKTLPGLQDAVKKGVVVVRGTRVPEGAVTHEKIDDENHFVTGDNLNPQKARILLMLALTKTQDPKVIQGYFDRY